MKAPKCRSRKHNPYGRGCTSPRCPEGLYVKKVVADALKNADVNAYLTARQMEHNPAQVVSVKKGVATIRVEGATPLTVSGPINRIELREQLTAMDKTSVPSFTNLKDLSSHVEELYSPYLTMRLSYKEDRQGRKSLYVADMNVDADLRSTGMGRHVRHMLAKHCDANNIMLFGTPTEAGDRSYDSERYSQVSPEEHAERSMAHKQRLIRYYEKTGYERNWAFKYVTRVDYLTNKPHDTNPEWKEKFNSQALTLLADAGEYVRWPNGEIPKHMLGRNKKDVQELQFADYWG
jgi:hypothetical protein